MQPSEERYTKQVCELPTCFKTTWKNKYCNTARSLTTTYYLNSKNWPWKFMDHDDDIKAQLTCRLHAENARHDSHVYLKLKLATHLYNVPFCYRNFCVTVTIRYSTITLICEEIVYRSFNCIRQCIHHNFLIRFFQEQNQSTLGKNVSSCSEQYGMLFWVVQYKG